jgi:hypothetical protein
MDDHQFSYITNTMEETKNSELEIFSHPKFNIVLSSYFAPPSNSLVENRTELRPMIY